MASTFAAVCAPTGCWTKRSSAPSLPPSPPDPPLTSDPTCYRTLAPAAELRLRHDADRLRQSARRFRYPLLPAHTRRSEYGAEPSPRHGLTCSTRRALLVARVLPPAHRSHRTCLS